MFVYSACSPNSSRRAESGAEPAWGQGGSSPLPALLPQELHWSKEEGGGERGERRKKKREEVEGEPLHAGAGSATEVGIYHHPAKYKNILVENF